MAYRSPYVPSSIAYSSTAATRPKAVTDENRFQRPQQHNDSGGNYRPGYGNYGVINVTNKPYCPPTQPKISTNSGYGSDYGKSGYVSGASDYGRSAYTSDYGKSGYVSGGGGGYASDYARSNAGYPTNATRTWQQQQQTQQRTPSQRYPTTTRSQPKSTYVSPYKPMRPSTATPTSSYARPLPSSSSAYSARVPPTSYGVRPSYSRSVSREEPRRAEAKVPPTVWATGGNGTVAAASQPRENKAPADFTTDDSTCSSSSEEDECCSPNGQVTKILVSRSTSPCSQRRSGSGPNDNNSVSAVAKMKVTRCETRRPLVDAAVQVEPAVEAPSPRSSTSSGRYTSSAIPRSTGSYYSGGGGYYSRYAAVPSRSTVSARSYGSGKNEVVKSSSATMAAGSTVEDGNKYKRQESAPAAADGKQSVKPTIMVPPTKVVIPPTRYNKEAKVIPPTVYGATAQATADQVPDENKDFRKSTLNMAPPARRGSSPRQPTEDGAQKQGVRKSRSRSKIVEDSGSDSSTEPEGPAPRRILKSRSRTKIHSEAEEGIQRSKSRSKMDDRRKSPRTSSQEDLLGGGERRRRNNSKENVLDADLPPRPSRPNSRENVLDERPVRTGNRSRSGSTENVLDDAKPPGRASGQDSPSSSQGKQLAVVPGHQRAPGGRGATKFIGTHRDIDSLLERNSSEPQGNFEDFESRYGGSSAPATLKLFIGKCKDIDDVLGGGTTLSPSPTARKTSPARFSPLVPAGSNARPVSAPPLRGPDDKLRARPQSLQLKPVADSSYGEEEEEESSEDEEGTTSSMEEVQARQVKVHDSAAQQPQLETYTEEIDSSAVRIRESRAQAPELHTYTEEIDPSGVRIRQPVKGNANIVTQGPAPKQRLDDCTLQVMKHTNSQAGDFGGTYLDLESTIDEQQEEFDNFLENRKNAIILRTQLSVRVHAIIEKLLHSEGRELRRALFSLKQIFQDDKDLVHEFVQNDGLSCLIKVGAEVDQNYQNYILRALGQVMLYVDGMNGVTAHNETVQWLYSLVASKFRLVVKTALKLLLVFVEYAESNCALLINAVNSVDVRRGCRPWCNVMTLLGEKDSVDMELLIYAMTLINKTLNGVTDQDTYYDVTDLMEEQGIERIITRYMTKPGTDLDLLQQFQIYEVVLKQEDGEDRGIVLLDPKLRQAPRSRKSLTAADDENDRRRSRRHSVGTVATVPADNATPVDLAEDRQRRWRQSCEDTNLNNVSAINGTPEVNGNLNCVTPALRRRRERDARHRTFIKEQEENEVLVVDDENRRNRERDDEGHRTRSRQREDNGIPPNKKSWMLSMMYSKSQDDGLADDEPERPSAGGNISPRISQAEVFDLRREGTVKDIQKKLRGQDAVVSPTDTSPRVVGDLSGIVSKAKEGLCRSASRPDVKPAPSSHVEVKRADNELQWEQLVKTLDRPLRINDLDFTDLLAEDDENLFEFSPKGANAPSLQMLLLPPPPPPPPPPSMAGGRVPPPPPPSPLPPTRLVVPPQQQQQQQLKTIKKNKKTLKLFWREVRGDQKARVDGVIWDELRPVSVDTQKLEHLFENRAKDLMTKKQQEMSKNKEIIVLDPKRSNAINICMTKLPPPRTIKTAILKMDSTIMTRDGIEKILTMMIPSEEEKSRIQEAQMNNPDVPLGSAEQFLLTLASINELPARLKLWAFKLDYEQMERDVAEPLQDLKQGVVELRQNCTLRCVLAVLLSVGNFLNGVEAKGFHIEYLAKVPEVKDTVHKHSLLHHLCHMVMEKFPDTTDLYSELGAICRSSKVDFDELSANLQRMETECKASWDHLKAVAKHDGSSITKTKMSEFLAECAERIIVLGIVHRRVLNRFSKLLLYMGIPANLARDVKVNAFLKIISEFALEYRTTRERVLQQMEKKANHRERNKTRGKMITDMGKFRSKDAQADEELRQLLGASSGVSDSEDCKWGTVPGVRGRLRKQEGIGRQGSNRGSWGRPMSVRDDNLTDGMTDGDDEILESLVKTATAPTVRSMARERKRARQADRKSLRRTLKCGLTDEEKKLVFALST